MMFHHFSFTKICSLPLILFLFLPGMGFSQDSAPALHNLEGHLSSKGFANIFYTKFNEHNLYAYSMPDQNEINFQQSTADNTVDFSKIGLQKSFWKGLQFTYKNSEPSGVFGFTGLSLNSDFKNIIGTNPTALEEAEKSYLFNGIALGGSIAMLWISLQYLLDTIDQADQVSGGNLYAETPTFNLGGFIIAAVVTGVGGYFGQDKIRNSVDIYNKNEPTDAPVSTVAPASPEKSKAPIVTTVSPPKTALQADKMKQDESQNFLFINRNLKAVFFSFSGLDNISANSINGGIGGKYFVNSQWAVRGGLQFDYQMETTPANPNSLQKGVDGEYSTTEFGLNGAFEYHLRDNRISPYLGAGLGYASRSVEFFNPILWSANYDGSVVKTTYKANDTSIYDVFAIAGGELFLTKWMSLSAEYQLTYRHISTGDMKVSWTLVQGSSPGYPRSETGQGPSSNNFGFQNSGTLTLAVYF